MKLIIEIDEEDYNFAKREVPDGRIANGIPLPKGHGRLLDEKDILDTENNDGGWYDLTDMPEYIAGVKPIIEADEEGGE